MPLMDRIKVNPFLSWTSLDKIVFIESLQLRRSNALEKARLEKTKARTKSATKNLKKKGKTVVDPKAAAIAALNKLTPSQIEKMKGLF